MRWMLLVLLVFVLFLAFNTVHASSVFARFNTINSTVSINQYIYFNISADFQTQVNYTIFLNNSAILNGTIPKNSSQYYLIKYNVSNMPSGTYEAHASLPNFNLVLNASKTVYIKPYSDFFFPGDNPVTEIVGNYSFINIIIENIGNTPLKMNWSLPEFINISYANLLYKQNFNLLPEQNYTIPTNLSLTGKYQKNISFAFTGKV